MYAIIRAGGKQYKVASGDVIQVDRVAADPGGALTFAPLMLVDGDNVKSTPGELEGLQVSGEVVGHLRGPKIRVSNYHAKTGWKKTKGHRQELSTVRITGIG
ncbi:MAG TPA: 50S ribosomal protein L21 [Actinomycetota bacterium]|nr:50S ribosomal protein L21 [Actinomycetota bacterium]